MNLKIATFVLVLLLLRDKTFRNQPFSDGEELIYDVYYSFINIGWAINTTHKQDIKTVTNAEAVLKSNEAMPL
jgi:hypothetical protein